MRIPGILRSVYWRYRLRRQHVRSWAELPIDEQQRTPSVAIIGNAGYLRERMAAGRVTLDPVMTEHMTGPGPA